MTNNLSRLLCSTLFCIISFTSFAQQSFEGIIEYQVEVKSKMKGINDESLKRMFALSNTLKSYIKQGHFLQTSESLSQYFIPERKLSVSKFKSSDSLYTISYDEDSAQVTEIKKEKKQQNILGYECKSITIKTNQTRTTFFYAPALYQDPALCQSNKLGQFNVFVNETQSVYLQLIQETEYSIVTYTAYKVKAQPLDDKTFSPPALPETKYEPEKLIKNPVYKNGDADWINYIMKNINPDIAAKYMKIPKGQKEATISAIVEFNISMTGQVTDAVVLNRKEMHPAIAKEAIRVVEESTGWKPATANGMPVDHIMQQKITFMCREE